MHRKNGSDKAFYLKQFYIHHDRCGMKVGTDGILLGSWADVQDKNKILDIGTGSGLIALMLAQRTGNETIIDAVEINEEAFKQACDNVANSPWPKKIKLMHSAVQNFESKTGYDLIVSNPPYFVQSLKPSNHKRAQSRHTTDLTFEELANSARRLINPAGTLSIILPNNEAKEFIKIAERSSLFINRQLSLRTKTTKPIDRMLLEFSLNPNHELMTNELIIQNINGQWTQPYLDLVSPFYPWA